MEKPVVKTPVKEEKKEVTKVVTPMVKKEESKIMKGMLDAKNAVTGLISKKKGIEVTTKTQK